MVIVRIFTILIIIPLWILMYLNLILNFKAHVKIAFKLSEKKNAKNAISFKDVICFEEFQ